ncbi:flagellar hook-associated protein FlgK [Motiliproteus sp. SC1-56]|uniref:flagellar hook-associated protein FlgK n=1 Tax=Motiliproteus sp. SC1-56 TaxID=2799565 RepID=UPI001A8C6307|nr:flagellar hook-associated protein FlgK [Motiliproteus sp. SC1-56]
MAGLLSIGLQALNVNQQALNTAGQNIANVNVEGYSRQRVEFSTRQAPEQGVQVVTVQRVADLFATRQLWIDTSAAASSQVFLGKASQMDNLLANSNTSISAALDEFFGALQTGVDDPTSIPNREVILAQSEALVRRFRDLDQLITQQNTDITNQAGTLAQQSNILVKEIAQLNEKISLAVARQEPANELKDQREELVRELSEMIGVTVQSSGENDDINLFIGNGQPLVVGNQPSEIKILPGDPDPDDLQVVVKVASREIEVGDDIRSGELGGLLQYREEVLKPAWNELGRLAMVLSDTMNSQHKKGMDLDGNLGIDMFKDLSLSGQVRAAKGNETDLVSQHLKITDASKLKASDYTLTFNGSGGFTLIRESDGTRIPSSSFKVQAPAADGSQAPGTLSGDLANGELQLNIDGFTLSIKGEAGFTQGDELLIQPVRNGAEDIELNIASGRQLALASPIRGEASIDNSGTGEIEFLEVTDPKAAFDSTGQLSPPAEIVFNSDGTYSVFDISNPADPQPYILDGVALTAQPFTSGEPIQLDGFAVTLANQPEPGDRFSFTYNTDGVSDNRNALALSNLQQAALVGQDANGEGGTSYQDVYGQLVERVGTETRVAQINAAANESVLKSTQSIRDSVAGVNLDEEAANIVKYQQAYQAATQLISTSRDLFNTLLGATGG